MRAPSSNVRNAVTCGPTTSTALDKLHSDFRIPYFADNIVYLTSDSETKRLDTDIFFSIFADHPQARPCLVGSQRGNHRRAVHP